MNKFKHLLVLLILLIINSSCNKNVAIKDDGNPTPTDSAIFHVLYIEGNKTIIKEMGGKYYFSADEILSKRQFNYLKHLSNNGIDSLERSTVISNLSKKWTNAIVYYKINYPAKRDSILKAMSHMSLRSRLKFVERTTQSNYLDFVVSPDPNTSSSQQIGMEGGRNELKISSGANSGVIIHEIMHAIGIFHEQERSDRDYYVTINNNNIIDAYEEQFNIAPGSTAVGSFDYSSIMLYGSYYFSVNGQPGMLKLNGDTIAPQRRTLTQGDVLGIEAIYGKGPELLGPDQMCSSASYNLLNLPAGASITWQVQGGAATGSVQGNTFVVNANTTGIYSNILITATLTIGTDKHILRKSVTTGGDGIIDEIWSQAGSSANSGMPVPFKALISDYCLAQTAEWEVSPAGSSTISYNSGLLCPGEPNNNVNVTITFHSRGSYQVKARVKNKCGNWTNWGYKTFTVN